MKYILSHLCLLNPFPGAFIRKGATGKMLFSQRFFRFTGRKPLGRFWGLGFGAGLRGSGHPVARPGGFLQDCSFGSGLLGGPNDTFSVLNALSKKIGLQNVATVRAVGLSVD